MDRISSAHCKLEEKLIHASRTLWSNIIELCWFSSGPLVVSFTVLLFVAPQLFLQLFISGTKAKCLAVSQIKGLSSSSQEKVE